MCRVLADSSIIFVIRMKRSIAYLVVSFIAAGALAAFTSIEVSTTVLNTIYTVAGVIFSVGMSITISPKTERVTNEKMRRLIRSSFLRVRDSFLFLFGISSVLFILSEILSIDKYPTFFVLLCALFLILSIIHYVFNFISLQNLGEQIEDQVIKELQQKPDTDSSDDVNNDEEDSVGEEEAPPQASS